MGRTERVREGKMGKDFSWKPEELWKQGTMYFGVGPTAVSTENLAKLLKSSTPGRRWFVGIHPVQGPSIAAIQEIAHTACCEITTIEKFYFYISGSAIDSTDDETKALLCAEELLTILNGMACIDLPWHRHVEDSDFIIDAVEIKRGPIVLRGLASKGRPSSFKVRSDLWQKAQLVKDIRDVLLALGEQSSWQKLRFIFEVIRSSVGGKNQLEKKRWASQAEILNFVDNAASRDVHGIDALHGRPISRSPDFKPMSLSEARSFVCLLTQKWIDDI
jgi:hypothetical protein